MNSPLSFRGACAALLSLPALAAPSPEIDEIRNEIRRLKEAYEARIDALEKRLQEAEAKPRQVQTAPGRVAAGERATPAFNPAMSLTLSGSYAHLQQDPHNYRIGGFMPGGEEIGPGRRGFRLSESELAVSANVDPYFYGLFTLALTPENEAEVEEAYFRTTALPAGLSLKGGRFFSGIGYLNEIHAHAWDFADNPLAYQAFLGRQYINDGVQLKWLAPTDIFFELGVEAGNGASFPGTERNKNGAGSSAALLHIGGDIGASNNWRAGVSYLRHSPRARAFDDVDSAATTVTNSFSGTSRLWIADFIWKWAPEGNRAARNFKLQGEYFRRNEKGDLAFDIAGASGAGPLAGSYDAKQSGWYLQAVYQFLPRLRTGLRYDRLDSGAARIGLVDNGAITSGDLPLLTSHRPTRSTLMFDFSPSEFSRVRLQFARDESRPDANDRQIFLQYIHSLGAHGAHRF